MASGSAASPGAPTDAELAAFGQKTGELLAAAHFDEALQAAEETWGRGWQRYEVAYAAACAASRGGKIDAALDWLQRSADTGLLGIRWMNEDPDLLALRADPRYAALLARARLAHQRHLAEMNVGGGLERSTPEAEGIDAAALRELLERAEAAHSSAVVILRHGRLVGDWYFGGASAVTETMSATKSITSLAIGLLLDEGKIRSLDEPISTWFPEWKDGLHDGITLRHLLSHTSGLHADLNTRAIYASPDFVRFALESGVDAPPGAEFFYNNNATNLVAGVVQRASGLSMDRYLGERLFAPLGIRDTQWTHDRAGNPHGMAGLQLHAADFAKLGQLMLQGGTWQGKRILSESWIAESTGRPSQELNPVCGLLWWLEAERVDVIIDEPFLAALRDRAADPAFIAKLMPLRDRPIPRPQLFEVLQRELGPDATTQWGAQVAQRRVNPRRVVSGEYEGFSARGSFGQLLVVFPSRDLVAVRFTEHYDGSDPGIEFEDFRSLVRALAAPESR